MTDVQKEDLKKAAEFISQANAIIAKVKDNLEQPDEEEDDEEEETDDLDQKLSEASDSLEQVESDLTDLVNS